MLCAVHLTFKACLSGHALPVFALRVLLSLPTGLSLPAVCGSVTQHTIPGKARLNRPWAMTALLAMITAASSQHPDIALHAECCRVVLASYWWHVHCHICLIRP